MVVCLRENANQLHFFLKKHVLFIQVDVPIFYYGDVVRVIDDMALVCSLQEGHGGWNDDIALVM